ncbi:MAG: bifunctional diaminohydroxyphosphoribosylaminopyrimidine deaminase/5-amino-6-(5-phosphoribosylamino)uracil reductase RibD [Candidatus Melainabacteria bacterium]|nr:bifunctional diaminohydroxyphosphoribosylaminopyrimidine deaminase/5-amino-6-(5-phosphoribosylamino)uracil reductase RibD [Candidatus Melainabacteria bacterium]
MQNQTFDRLDMFYMQRCLSLAWQGWGSVSPNPMVGAVVLDAKGRKVGEGFHAQAGGPHAEVVALNQAGEAAQGGTLFVNLEPCNHTGKTPPCTERIIQSGIQQVFCGTLDPNPLVYGSGRDALQNARISFKHGFLEAECLQLNEIFFHYITTRRPFITLKLAMTADGRIAARNGDSQWITGPTARQYVHHLRSGYDAILTTAQTVMADNPALTVRTPQLNPRYRPPIRIILDRHFRLNPETYRIFNKEDAPTVVVTSRVRHHRENALAARTTGIEVLEVDDTGTGLDLVQLLCALGEKSITSILVESGGRLATQLLSAQLVNKCHLFYAPTILADSAALPGFGGGPVLSSLEQRIRFHRVEQHQLEQDWLLTLYPETVNTEQIFLERTIETIVDGSVAGLSFKERRSATRTEQPSRKQQPPEPETRCQSSTPDSAKPSSKPKVMETLVDDSVLALEATAPQRSAHSAAMPPEREELPENRNQKTDPTTTTAAIASIHNEPDVFAQQNFDPQDREQQDSAEAAPTETAPSTTTPQSHASFTPQDPLVLSVLDILSVLEQEGIRPSGRHDDHASSHAHVDLPFEFSSRRETHTPHPQALPPAEPPSDSTEAAPPTQHTDKRTDKKKVIALIEDDAVQAFYQQHPEKRPSS